MIQKHLKIQFKVTIPYRARVVSGRLFVNESVVRFHLKDETVDGYIVHPKIARNLTVKNEFSVPVSFHLSVAIVRPKLTYILHNYELCCSGQHENIFMYWLNFFSFH